MSFKLLQLPIYLATLSLAQSAMAQSVTVFVDGQTPLQNSSSATAIFELDAAQRIEERMSADLPGNLQQAEQLMRTRMQSSAWRAMEIELQRSAEGLAKAKALGVTKLPAVVVDERYVVYGVTDVKRAVEMANVKGGGHEAD